MSGAPWSVKGIDPKAREVAKGLARRSGMTLGEWLNRVILEDDVFEDAAPEPRFGARLNRTETSLAAKSLMPSAPSPGRSDELGRIAQALDQLTDRIEASETRTGLAISGVEHSVRHAVARIETAEREHMAVASRFESASERLDSEQARTSERLRRMDAEPAGPRSVEALQALEQSVTRVATHVYEGDGRTRDTLAGLEARLARAETSVGADSATLIDDVVSRLGARLGAAENHTSEALESLRHASVTLDDRMRAVEGGARGELDQRLAALADQLTRRIEDTRVEIADRLAASGGARMEAEIGAIAAQIGAVEQRSARAIESMGREVLTMADTLTSRVRSAEHRSAKAIEQVGGEIARIAGAVENRLGRVDQLHAEALERLGTEIGNITERLSDRLIQSERRAAQAIDDVGEQVAKVTERIEQRHERAASDLAERIRQSEERTAAMLEGARAKLNAGSAPSETSAETPAPAADMVDGAAPAGPAFVSVAAVFGPELFSRAEPISQPTVDPGNPAFGHEDFDAADGFAPIFEAEAEAEDVARSVMLADEPAQETVVPKALTQTVDVQTPPLSTRDVIEQARAAARAAAAVPRPKTMMKLGGGNSRLRAGGLYATIKARPPSTWQTALMVAGGAAFLSVGAAGVVLIEGPAVKPDSQVATPLAVSARAALALNPQVIDAGATVSRAPVASLSTPATQTATATATYEKTVHAVEQREPGALAKLKAMADNDQSAAQIYLAKLYETGGAGVLQNLSEARRWTARAADAGDASAMHNLALYYFRGEGGAQNTAGAAQWFRKAADRGVVDSQYNLGLLYQSGSGVGRDLGEAYKWFSIAAKGGDGEAHAKALEIEGKLTGAQRSAAETSAAGFKPDPDMQKAANSQKHVNSSPANVQKILGRLGYYKGSASNADTRELQVAVANYQRDQGLPPTGSLDPITASRLSVFTR